MAQDMCKKYASEFYMVALGELDNIKDLRVHSEMYPTDAKNVYKACLAGLRRQTH